MMNSRTFLLTAIAALGCGDTSEATCPREILVGGIAVCATSVTAEDTGVSTVVSLTRADACQSLHDANKAAPRMNLFIRTRDLRPGLEVTDVNDGGANSAVVQDITVKPERTIYAESGRLTIREYKPGESLAGDYDLVFKTGERIQGSFSTCFCTNQCSTSL